MSIPPYMNQRPSDKPAEVLIKINIPKRQIHLEAEFTGQTDTEILNDTELYIANLVTFLRELDETNNNEGEQ